MTTGRLTIGWLIRDCTIKMKELLKGFNQHVILFYEVITFHPTLPLACSFTAGRQEGYVTNKHSRDGSREEKGKVGPQVRRSV